MTIRRCLRSVARSRSDSSATTSRGGGLRRLEHQPRRPARRRRASVGSSASARPASRIATWRRGLVAAGEASAVCAAREVPRGERAAALRDRDRRRGSAGRVSPSSRARASRSSRSSCGRGDAQRRRARAGSSLRRGASAAGATTAGARGCSGCAGEDLEQDAAERVDVGARVEVVVAARLLGRHVAGRADTRPRRRRVERRSAPRRRARRDRAMPQSST